LNPLGLFMWKRLVGNELYKKQAKNKIEPISLRSLLKNHN
jgi:hypothetical protein